MNENKTNANNELIIDISELIQFLKSKWKLYVLTILLFSISSGLVTNFLISKKYESTTRLFLKPDVTEGIVNYNEITSNNLMVNNYVELLKGNNIHSKVASNLGVSVGTISNSLSVSKKMDTQIITITSKTEDPELSKKIVEEVVEVFTKETEEILNVNNIIVVDQAKITHTPVSPNLRKNILISAITGALLSIGYAFLRFILDTHIHNQDEAQKYLGIPSLGTVPWFED